MEKVTEYKICKYCGELFLTGSNDPNICDQCEENIFVIDLEEQITDKVRCAYCSKFLKCHEPDTEKEHMDLIHCDSFQEVEALQNQSLTTKEE